MAKRRVIDTLDDSVLRGMAVQHAHWEKAPYSVEQSIEMLNLTSHKRDGIRACALDLSLRRVARKSIKYRCGQSCNSCEGRSEQAVVPAFSPIAHSHTYSMT